MSQKALSNPDPRLLIFISTLGDCTIISASYHNFCLIPNTKNIQKLMVNVEEFVLVIELLGSMEGDSEFSWGVGSTAPNCLCFSDMAQYHRLTHIVSC